MAYAASTEHYGYGFGGERLRQEDQVLSADSADQEYPATPAKS